MFWSAICALGYILLMVVPRSSPGASYFAVFIAVSGAAPMIATTISWTGNTWGNSNHYKKAIAMGESQFLFTPHRQELDGTSAYRPVRYGLLIR